MKAAMNKADDYWAIKILNGNKSSLAFLQVGEEHLVGHEEQIARAKAWAVKRNLKF
jgi:hypothetical protein